MVALLDLEDLIVALNREPASAEEAAQWQFYIDSVSAFINGYVDSSFEEIEDDVVRDQADYYGVIDLGGDPVSVVSSVKDWRTGQETVWDFNGMDKLRYLEPNQVVDVTYTHGYAVVPDDVKFMAVEAVKGVLGLGATGDLTSYTVGDITEVYNKESSSGATVTVVSLSEQTLKKYKNQQFSMRMGAGQIAGTGLSSSTGLPTL